MSKHRVFMSKHRVFMSKHRVFMSKHRVFMSAHHRTCTDESPVCAPGPADALRVFMSAHHRTYTDESPVCAPGPADALRVFMSAHHRTYTDESPVCAPGPADALRVFMSAHHRTYTDESPVCAPGPADALRVFMSAHHRTYTDGSPEFPQRRRIFTSNAEGIREENALIKILRKGEGAKLLGVNTRSDTVLTSEMKYGGERMDHYFDPPRHSEREAMLLMGIHARVPDHLRSSTHDRMELRLGDREAPATCKANSQKPASKQHATQELASQDANGSTFAARAAKSLKLVGNTSLHEAAEHHRADAYRVFVGKLHLSHTDESPDFPVRLKIFTINAQIIREENALIKEKEGDDAKFRPLPPSALHNC
ncbi:hypothetical protein CVIRNUC_001713 [Coccomyxa viridis]|uniref:Uncharacterized protein n=1 Tax=Coccomyxa viridis TaxID=1274662 RepID=A0AAV1HYB2_9CHLO|nr:hypothetical protein CVIRNUC_001713 [Coccomyxa viridis]